MASEFFALAHLQQIPAIPTASAGFISKSIPTDYPLLKNRGL